MKRQQKALRSKQLNDEPLSDAGALWWHIAANASKESDPEMTNIETKIKNIYSTTKHKLNKENTIMAKNDKNKMKIDVNNENEDKEES